MKVRILEKENGITIKDLRDWIANIPDVNHIGEDMEIWMETGKNLTSPVVRIVPLNWRNIENHECCDVLLESNKYE